ncbi:CHCH domain-containing protein [Colletotrichum acutatum]|uniref:CHCH domain-containing protein n=1 Tax=Glomerella acutata TaxID=27357 RepID=A0AAD8XH27_GLOAC|nr:CHCH domain-containing protein [Colletotrichum acutatum]KAK1724558.1 CHCH domain-containing protein [Colletotrichum acutatum]
MSQLGGPGSRQANAKPIPPQRGSFPLDHDGECKHVIATYLECIKKVRGVNDAECRDLAKSYLACRMDRNLMAKDEFRNLGFDNGPKPANDPSGLGLSQAQAQGSTGKDKDAKPGELRW